MSLNWKEIDLALSELALEGAQIQKILQPSWDTIALSCYKPPKATMLLICISHGACRLHATTMDIPKAIKPQRFMELLRAHIKNLRILNIQQLGSERIVKLSLGKDTVDKFLYIRLWSGAGNIILTNTDGTIIDALARKPGKGEISAAVYAPQPGPDPLKSYSIREYSGFASFNEFLDSFYSTRSSSLSYKALSEKLEKFFLQKEAGIDARIAQLKQRAELYSDPGRLKEMGDLLMANQTIPLTGSIIELNDFYRTGSVLIKVDPDKNIIANAEYYYYKAKKAKSSLEETIIDLNELARKKEAINIQKQKLSLEENPWVIKDFLLKHEGSKIAKEKPSPGITIIVNDWKLLIGRSASDNEELLKHHAKGNDLWLHARDYSGSFVFIKTRPGKSFPLDLMLDAGMLALYYSKGRERITGDIYYTMVKYLKRVKGGPKGMVIPGQEKNLRVKIEDHRIKELLSSLEADEKFI